MISVLYALLAMFMWGISDATVKALTGRYDVLRTTVYKFVPHVGFLFLFFLLSGPVWPDPVSWMYLIGFGVLGAVALYTFIKSISLGSVSIAVAIAHTNIIFTVILSAFLLGEILGPLQYVAIIGIVIGVLMITVDFKKLNFANVTAFKYAMVTAVGWGIIYVLLKPPSDAIGGFAAAFYADFLVVLILTLIFLFARKRGYKKITRKDYGIIALSAFASSIAAASTGLAFENGYASLSMAIIGAAPLSTLIIASIFLKEKIARLQVLGIVVVTVGIVLLSV